MTAPIITHPHSHASAQPGVRALLCAVAAWHLRALRLGGQSMSFAWQSP